MFEKRKIKSQELFEVKDLCIGCGLCAKVCQFNNIKMIDEKTVWNDSCEHCSACIHWCPKSVIEYGKATIGKRRYTNPTIRAVDVFRLDE